MPVQCPLWELVCQFQASSKEFFPSRLADFAWEASSVKPDIFVKGQVF